MAYGKCVRGASAVGALADARKALGAFYETDAQFAADFVENLRQASLGAGGDEGGWAPGNGGAAGGDSARMHQGTHDGRHSHHPLDSDSHDGRHSHHPLDSDSHQGTHDGRHSHDPLDSDSSGVTRGACGARVGAQGEEGAGAPCRQGTRDADCTWLHRIFGLHAGGAEGDGGGGGGGGGEDAGGDRGCSAMRKLCPRDRVMVLWRLVWELERHRQGLREEQGRALLEASALALECGQLDKCERLLGDSRASFADAELSQAKAAACCRAADALMKRVVLCRATLGRGQEVVRQAEKAMAVFDLLSARRLLSSSLSLSLSHTHTLSLSLARSLSSS